MKTIKCFKCGVEIDDEKIPLEIKILEGELDGKNPALILDLCWKCWMEKWGMLDLFKPDENDKPATSQES